MASYALLFFGSEDAKAGHLPGFAAGDTIGALALDSLDKEAFMGTLLEADEMNRLSGRVPVLGGADADVVFALADGPGNWVVSVAEQPERSRYGIAIRVGCDAKAQRT